MPEQALYLKWRPMAFDDVVGQEHVMRTLRNALTTGRVRHAYLFSGPRGIGKTTTARLLAKAVNCHDPDPAKHPCNVCAACSSVNEGRYLDLIEIDAATHTGVDDVRDLRDKIAFTPGEGRYKVYIIDEVHRFTGNAFDALLKTLEEPPDHAIFVLATTEIDKVPATIKSRCLQFEFRRVSLQKVADRLQLIVESEGLKAERPALELIARQGTGSVRDSISLLDQIVADPNEVITLELAQRILGTASIQAVRDLVYALIEQDAAYGLEVINHAVDSGSDPRQFGQQVVEHLRNVLLAQTAGAGLVEASDEERGMYTEQAQRIERGMLLRAVRAFNEAVNNYRGGWQPQLSLELALIESLQPPDVQVITVPVAAQAGQPQSSAASPEPEAEPLPAGAPPVISLEVVRQKWAQMQKVAYQVNRSLPALMEHTRPQMVDGNTVVVGVRNGIFLEKLNRGENRTDFARALTAVHKTRLGCRFSLVADFDSLPQVAAPEADGADEDPLVRMAREELGAEVHFQDNVDDGDDDDNADE